MLCFPGRAARVAVHLPSCVNAGVPQGRPILIEGVALNQLIDQPSFIKSDSKGLAIAPMTKPSDLHTLYHELLKGSPSFRMDGDVPQHFSGSHTMKMENLPLRWDRVLLGRARSELRHRIDNEKRQQRRRLSTRDGKPARRLTCCSLPSGIPSRRNGSFAKPWRSPIR
jgi:hypothetical protein